jgi:hypothetical protein
VGTTSCQIIYQNSRLLEISLVISVNCLIWIVTITFEQKYMYIWTARNKVALWTVPLIPSITDIKVTTSPWKDRPFLLDVGIWNNTKFKNSELKKNFGTNFGPLCKEKILQPYNNCSNHIYVTFYCASNGKKIIFCFCISIELCLIKGWFFWLLEIQS